MRNERRSYARVRLELPANLYLVEGDIFHSGATFDLSLGGCFLPMGEKLPVGEACEIHLTLGEGILQETLKLAGKIARNGENGVGIEFIAAQEGQSNRLKQLLDKT
jgi:hypothetical protein